MLFFRITTVACCRVPKIIPNIRARGISSCYYKEETRVNPPSHKFNRAVVKSFPHMRVRKGLTILPGKPLHGHKKIVRYSY